MIQRTKELPSLMTREEMRERLAAGEEPLPLSVEKYERVIAVLESGQVVDGELISGGTCPLCEVYHNHHLNRWCQISPQERCLLYEWQGCCPCGADGTVWSRLDRLAVEKDWLNNYLPSTPETIAAAKAVLAVLKELCNAES